jgi:hypothetical protein
MKGVKPSLSPSRKESPLLAQSNSSFRPNVLQSSITENNRKSTSELNGGNVSERSDSISSVQPSQRLHVLDKACNQHGGSYSYAEVAGVKLVFRLFPFLAVMIMYWGVYSQMSTAFQNQGCQMSLFLGKYIYIYTYNIFYKIYLFLNTFSRRKCSGSSVGIEYVRYHRYFAANSRL